MGEYDPALPKAPVGAPVAVGVGREPRWHSLRAARPGAHVLRRLHRQQPAEPGRGRRIGGGPVERRQGPGLPGPDPALQDDRHGPPSPEPRGADLDRVRRRGRGPATATASFPPNRLKSRRRQPRVERSALRPSPGLPAPVSRTEVCPQVPGPTPETRRNPFTTVLGAVSNDAVRQQAIHQGPCWTLAHVSVNCILPNNGRT